MSTFRISCLDSHADHYRTKVWRDAFLNPSIHTSFEKLISYFTNFKPTVETRIQLEKIGCYDKPITHHDCSAYYISMILCFKWFLFPLIFNNILLFLLEYIIQTGWFSYVYFWHIFFDIRNVIHDVVHCFRIAIYSNLLLLISEYNYFEQDYKLTPCDGLVEIKR